MEGSIQESDFGLRFSRSLELFSRGFSTRLAGRVAAVTGAGSGIGKSIATLFAAEGARVVVVDTDSQGGNDTVSAIEKNRGEAFFVQTDVSKSDQTKHLVDLTVARYDRIDVLCNSVGVSVSECDDTVVNLREDEWDKVINTNLKSVYLGMKHVVPVMIRNGGGSIVNIGSVCSTVADYASSVYCASKGGVLMLSKAAALDYAKSGVRINCILPAIVDVPLVEKRLASSSNREKMRQVELCNYPIRRPASLEEIAQLALFLASNESYFITGAAIPIDGGYTII